MIKELFLAASVGMMALNPFAGYKEMNEPMEEVEGSGEIVYTEIICVVGDSEDYTVYELDDKYIPCTNVFEHDDTVHIEKEDWKKGNLLHIKFYHDDILELKQIEDFKIIYK